MDNEKRCPVGGVDRDGKVDRIIKDMKDYQEAVDKLVFDKETIVSLIHSVKHCMGELHHYESDDGKVEKYLEITGRLDKELDRGHRLLETLENILLKDWYMHDDLLLYNANEAAGWYYVEDELPPYHTDILFCNKVGQVFEGFLEERDTRKPFLTKDKKISFKKYPDGGAWFDFRFRRFHKMKQVVAWCYKPEAAKTRVEAQELKFLTEGRRKI